MRWALVPVAVVGCWAAIDLLGPRSHDLRDFRPDAVARLDTAMWRSYYDHERLRLFAQLAELLRGQFGLPRLRSYVVAFHGARAAVVFQRGHARADYEQALPDLRRFYSAIARVAAQRFDVERAARLELEWWIVHRERERHAPDDLPRALAELQAELYGVPAERLMEHGRERALAMVLRDGAAERQLEPDWKEIEKRLQHSWRWLWDEVHAGSVQSIFRAVPYPVRELTDTPGFRAIGN